MKNIYFIHVIFLSLILSGCTSSDDEALVNDGERKLRQLTITQVENDAATRSLFDLTRASLTENEADNTLSASWTEGDKLSLCILTDLTFSPSRSVGTLTALENAETSAFSTTIIESFTNLIDLLSNGTTIFPSSDITPTLLALTIGSIASTNNVLAILFPFENFLSLVSPKNSIAFHHQ